MFPALIGRILFSLVCRKLWPYPSFEDLRDHRTEIDEADKFWEMMTVKMSSSSVVTELEIRRLFRLADQTMNITRRKHAKGKETIPVDDSDLHRRIKLQYGNQPGRARYQAIVDLHERIRNCLLSSCCLLLFQYFYLAEAGFVAEVWHSKWFCHSRCISSQKY